MNFEKRAEALVWSALMKGYNHGLTSAFTKYESVIWVNPKKNDSCQLCKALHGTKLNKADAMRILPAHPNCNCHVIPAG